MTIAQNSLIDFFGTQDTVTTSGPSTNDGAYGDSGADWTNDDDAPEAAFAFVGTWATATSINGTHVSLFAEVQNIQSTNPADSPSDDNPVIRLGSFRVPQAVTSAQYMPLEQGIVRLPNHYSSTVYRFWIKNETGQTLSANWSLYVTPVTVGPHPA